MSDSDDNNSIRKMLWFDYEMASAQINLMFQIGLISHDEADAAISFIGKHSICAVMAIKRREPLLLRAIYAARKAACQTVQQAFEAMDPAPVKELALRKMPEAWAPILAEAEGFVRHQHEDMLKEISKKLSDLASGLPTTYGGLKMVPPEQSVELAKLLGLPPGSRVSSAQVIPIPDGVVPPDWTPHDCNKCPEDVRSICTLPPKAVWDAKQKGAN
jgi:hypothetical protein